MKKEFSKGTRADFFKIWVMFGIVLTTLWSGFAFCWGSPKPYTRVSIPTAIPQLVSATTSNVDVIPELTGNHQKISSALTSELSLERAGISALKFSFSLKDPTGQALKVNFADNRMNRVQETLIFRPNKPVKELDTALGVSSDTIDMPYCLLRVRVESPLSSPKSLSSKKETADIWLPGLVRYQENDDSVRLSFSFIPSNEGASNSGEIEVNELECHFMYKNLEGSSIYDVLRGVLGSNVEIAYRLE